MVVEHDYVGSARAEVGHFGTGGSAAVDRDQQLRLMRLPAAFDSFSTQAIALFHPRRQKERGRIPIGGKHLVQERKRGHAIDVVVAVEHDPLAFVDRPQDAANRSLDIWKGEWITEMTQAWTKKC
jgi:hypothetical protein